MLTYSAYFLCRLIKLLLDCEKQEFSPPQIKNDTFSPLPSEHKRHSNHGILFQAIDDIRGLVSIYSVKQTQGIII